MDLTSKKQYMDTLRERYFKGSKKEKGEILDEYCRNTSQERKYVIKKFNYRVKLKTNRKKRKRIYGGETIAVLVQVWKIFDYSCGQRLKPMIADEIERLRKQKEIICSDQIAEQLKAIGIATIDRRLKHEKEVLLINRKNRERNPLLSHQIPVKTSSEFDRKHPGHTQVDFVEHCGSSANGNYVNTMSFVEVFSDWWEGEAVMGKGQERSFIAFKNIRKRLPFTLLGIHPDNQNSLINYHVYGYCQKENIDFTRSRPYKKNDNCFVEQKNWTHVRKMVGYLRHDTEQELEILNDLYRQELRLYKNFFQPVIKLKDKIRVNGKIHKRYDDAKTPYRRLMDSPGIRQEVKNELTAIYERLNPAELKRQIDKKLKRLNMAYDCKKGRINAKELNSNFGVISPRRRNLISVS